MTHERPNEQLRGQLPGGVTPRISEMPARFAVRVSALRPETVRASDGCPSVGRLRPVASWLRPVASCCDSAPQRFVKQELVVALIANHEMVVHVLGKAVALIESLSAQIFTEDAKHHVVVAALQRLF